MPMSANDRAAQRLDFVRRHQSTADFRIAPASADASFRSYWRVQAGSASLILMDAPPDKEPIEIFASMCNFVFSTEALISTVSADAADETS